ncbi:hypothetical protein ACX93W_08535 [Paenibacillus sp. CAU 1782]
MDQPIRQYYRLKQKQKELEEQLAELRVHILDQLREQDVLETSQAGYRAKIVVQERKEYDGEKLFAALPDLELWRLLSKPDAGKIAGLLKLNVIAQEQLAGTFETKEVLLLQVERQ